jgi:predicted amidohydrolase YtcJ
MGDAMHAETVLRDGVIHTQDPARARARSVAISGGRIVAFDDAAEGAIGPDTRVENLEGRGVAPGFVDAHIHFSSFALARQQVDLDVASTLESALREIGKTRTRPGAWIKGRGWDRNRWGRLPTAEDLDDVTGERPAVFGSHDGHAMWLNSAALRASGIDSATRDPAGGVIERDAHGDPTGVLFENAQDLVRHTLPAPTPAELADALRHALPLAAAAGLTGIHNFEDRHARAAFGALETNRELTLRVYHGISRGELKHATEQGLRTGAGSDWLRIGPVKLFADGALGSRTAHLLEPYAQRSDSYRGVATLQPEALDDAIRLATDAQLDVAVHAIGDAAVRSVLDAFERARSRQRGRTRQRARSRQGARSRQRVASSRRGTDPRSSRRAAVDARQQQPQEPEQLQQAKELKEVKEVFDLLHRIEHAQLVHPDDLPRFAALDVIASMQPIHAAADWRTADAHWGERSRFGYAWRTLLDAGATLAFGTDAPVERIEPLLTLYAATTRRDLQGEPPGGWYPAQRISVAQAVAAYTLGSARAEHASHRRGMLRIGMDADLVVLEPDPFSLPADALRDVRVALTMVGGRIVFHGG